MKLHKTIKEELKEKGINKVVCSGGPFGYVNKIFTLDEFDMFNFQVIRIENDRAIALWLD